ncbi:Chromosome partition protein Smc [Carpediemonas membranifera]|uniref:Chromosome partition protein Smc n=1 Tax=Carpediemonas membranifera TaxID=201153 RepID=A0A8J6BYU8_9EUKA|nr:Chromosome partition protein Smc [Carpediemonas membranifera]|eukprot:KAG9394896.1 Chromosome partition protein Smc [Carpediemonas membranifera]
MSSHEPQEQPSDDDFDPASDFEDDSSDSPESENNDGEFDQEPEDPLDLSSTEVKEALKHLGLVPEDLKEYTMADVRSESAGLPKDIVKVRFDHYAARRKQYMDMIRSELSSSDSMNNSPSLSGLKRGKSSTAVALEAQRLEAAKRKQLQEVQQVLALELTKKRIEEENQRRLAREQQRMEQREREKQEARKKAADAEAKRVAERKAKAAREAKAADRLKRKAMAQEREMAQRRRREEKERREAAEAREMMLLDKKKEHEAKVAAMQAKQDVMKTRMLQDMEAREQARIAALEAEKAKRQEEARRQQEETARRLAEVTAKMQQEEADRRRKMKERQKKSEEQRLELEARRQQEAADRAKAEAEKEQHRLAVAEKMKKEEEDRIASIQRQVEAREERQRRKKEEEEREKLIKAEKDRLVADDKRRMVQMEERKHEYRAAVFEQQLKERDHALESHEQDLKRVRMQRLKMRNRTAQQKAMINQEIAQMQKTGKMSDGLVKAVGKDVIKVAIEQAQSPSKLSTADIFRSSPALRPRQSHAKSTTLPRIGTAENSGSNQPQPQAKPSRTPRLGPKARGAASEPALPKPYRATSAPGLRPAKPPTARPRAMRRPTADRRQRFVRRRGAGIREARMMADELRRTQNESMLRLVMEEQQKEAERALMLQSVVDPIERERLQAIFEIERGKANRNLLNISSHFEQNLAMKLADIGFSPLDI